MTTTAAAAPARRPRRRRRHVHRSPGEWWHDLSGAMRMLIKVVPILLMFGSAFWWGRENLVFAGDLKMLNETIKHNAAHLAAQQAAASAKAEAALAAAVKENTAAHARAFLQNDKAFLELRRSGLADNIFKLESQAKRTPSEQATLLRFKSELDGIDRQIRDRQRRLDDGLIVK